MQLNITHQEAQEFLHRQQIGDNLGLKYLYAILKDYHNNDPMCRLVKAAWDLNDYIILIELGEIPFNGVIDGAYRDIMMELIEAAKRAAGYPID